MFFKRRHEQNNSVQIKAAQLVSYDESHFELMLDQVMNFINAFKSVLPGEWYFLDLYADAVRTSYESSLFVESGRVVFKVTIGNWWDGLLRQFPDVEDYMFSVFNFDPQEKTFIATIRAGQTENQLFPTSSIVGLPSSVPQ